MGGAASHRVLAARLRVAAPRGGVPHLRDVARGGGVSGSEAVIAYDERLFQQFDSTRIELEELLPAGDRVMVVSRQHAVPKAGAEAIVVQVIEVWTVRDGMLAERRTFATREEALEAMGVRG